MLERNLNLIRKIVWGFVKGNPGLEFDDLFSEACLACLEAQASYNPDKGKESTFVHHVVTNQLRTLLKKEAVKLAELQYATEMEEVTCSNTNPEQQVIIQEEWREFFNSLSPKSKRICEMVLNDFDADSLMSTPKLYRGKLAKQLKSENWSWSSIWGSFGEIRRALS